VFGKRASTPITERQISCPIDYSDASSSRCRHSMALRGIPSSSDVRDPSLSFRVVGSLLPSRARTTASRNNTASSLDDKKLNHMGMGCIPAAKDVSYGFNCSVCVVRSDQAMSHFPQPREFCKHEKGPGSFVPVTNLKGLVTRSSSDMMGNSASRRRLGGVGVAQWLGRECRRFVY
jgi:hypothetical protein